ncbi:MAG: glycosyltransferase family 2 protein [Andreesenia angusta]|nr:glycosyltransferase family 2 protein [Andreesenia angusta]
MNKKKSIDIIIPAFNEEDKIKYTLDALKTIENSRIILIDDDSNDRTIDIVKGLSIPKLLCIKHDTNRGKGKAVKTGIENSDADIICLLDADLGDTAIEAEKLIAPVINNEADFTIARFGKAKKKGGFGLVKKLAAWGVKHYTGVEMSTTLSGQRAYKREVLEDIKYIPDDFGMEIAMTVEALMAGYSFKEIDVNMTHSESGRDLKGFKHRGKQFLDILKTIIKLKSKCR